MCTYLSSGALGFRATARIFDRRSTDCPTRGRARRVVRLIIAQLQIRLFFAPPLPRCVLVRAVRLDGVGGLGSCPLVGYGAVGCSSRCGTAARREASIQAAGFRSKRRGRRESVGRRATRPRGVSWVCWARPAFLAPPPAWPFGSRPAPSIPTRFRSKPVVLGYCSGAGLGFWIVCSNSNFDTWGRLSLATVYTSRRPPSAAGTRPAFVSVPLIESDRSKAFGSEPRRGGPASRRGYYYLDRAARVW